MISDKLAQDIVALSEELVSATTPIEFIPGCQILDVADANAYGANNGWLEAFCGRHNRQRCRLYGTVLNPKVGTFVNVLYLPSTKRFLVLSAGNPSGDLLGFLQWRSPWSPSETYTTDDVVEKDGWLMRANKETTDPPDPQLVRTFWGVPDAPSWTTNNVTDGVNTGLRIQMTGAGIFISTRARFWAPSQSSSVEYQILVRDNLTEQIEVYAVLSGNETDAGWNIIDFGETLILDNSDDVTLWLHTVDFATTTQFAGDWVMTLSNQDATPPSGGAHRRTNRTYVRFHKTDNASGDRSAELLAVIPGTTITSPTGANWTVVGVSDAGTYVEYDLTVTSDPTAGVATYTFNVPVPTPVNYVSLASYWTPQPNANLSGHLILDSAGPPGTENDTAYGIDAEIREYTASPDWDFMAFSSVGSVVEPPAPTPVVTLGAGRNFILNGDFQIDQMNMGQIFNVNSDTDVLDIWKWRHSGPGDMLLQRLASVNELNGHRFEHIFQALYGATGAPALNDYAMLTYPIEGADLLRLWNKIGSDTGPMTLSFWAYFSKTGTFNVSIQNRVETLSYIADFTINAVNTWEYKTITIPRRAWSDGFDTDNGLGLLVSFCVRCGSARRAPGVSTWYPANYYGSPNLNDFDAINDSMLITGIQLEAGNVATKFENLSPTTHLKKIQRYYERISPISANIPLRAGALFNSDSTNSPLPYHEKRVAPTMTYSALDDFKLISNVGGAPAGTPTSIQLNDPNLNVGSLICFGWTPTPAISGGAYVYLVNGPNSFIDLSARLI